MYKFIIALVSVLLGVGALQAETSGWQVPPGAKQIPIWPATPPDPQPDTGPEVIIPTTNQIVAGRPFTLVGSVQTPTITLFPARQRNTGVAGVVFPGGGYEDLAMDPEGTEVCDWLTSKGISCVLLKYRVPGPGLYSKPAPHRKSGPYPRSPVALQDAQRALSLVRYHAKEWSIDPHKVGVIGFSAGGHLAAATSTHYEKRVYAEVDASDRESCRPDFAVLLYPGHLWNVKYEKTPKFALNPDIPVTQGTPPSFILQAQDDPVDDVNNSLVYYVALREAKVPVEMHLFSEGGHAFGLRPTEHAVTEWPGLVERWLVSIKMIPNGP